MGAEGCSHFDTQATNSHLPAIHSFRAESMRVRHSRVQLAVTPSSEEAEETKSWLPSLPQFKLASHNKGDSDDNWSLVDLLSRSNSAKSQAPSTTRFAVTPIPKLRLLNKKIALLLQFYQEGLLRRGLAIGGAQALVRPMESH